MFVIFVLKNFVFCRLMLTPSLNKDPRRGLDIKFNNKLGKTKQEKLKSGLKEFVRAEKKFYARKKKAVWRSSGVRLGLGSLLILFLLLFFFFFTVKKEKEKKK
ncbi:unnamed protein product [Ixodes pacificus]